MLDVYPFEYGYRCGTWWDPWLRANENKEMYTETKNKRVKREMAAATSLLLDLPRSIVLQRALKHLSWNRDKTGAGQAQCRLARPVISFANREEFLLGLLRCTVEKPKNKRHRASKRLERLTFILMVSLQNRDFCTLWSDWEATRPVIHEQYLNAGWGKGSSISQLIRAQSNQSSTTFLGGRTCATCSPVIGAIHGFFISAGLDVRGASCFRKNNYFFPLDGFQII